MKIEARKGKWLISALLLWLAFAPVAQAFYNPSTGRWLNRDPAGERTSDGPNVNAFARNNPIDRFDTDGRESWGPPFFPPPPPPPQTDPTGFAICHRDFESDGTIIDAIMMGVGNLGGGQHTYVHYKECNKCPTKGWGFSGGGPRPHPDDEKHFKPNDCKSCRRTDSTLKNDGSGKGKKGTDATDAEIAECIKNSPIVKQFSNTIRNRYVCSTWANQATSECGLNCK